MSKSLRLPALCALLLAATSFTFSSAPSGLSYDSVATMLLEAGLRNCEAFEMLKELTSQAPHRLSGSKGAAKAVDLAKQMMLQRGFDNVHLETVTVPHWVRGPVEEAMITRSAAKRGTSLTVCALGGSIATPKNGIEGEVVEVRSLDEAKALGGSAKNKIIFYNRAFDPTKLNTFEAYGGAVDQRSRGAIAAARVGAVAVLVRSMTDVIDDVPHTGMMNYADTVKKIPAAAISTLDAEMLSRLLSSEKSVRVRLKLSCQTLQDAPSANVVGEITGSEKPNEIIVVGGHLDCWDKGQGAHDDGAGCVQAIEVVNLIKKLGLRPKRTIRAVMFMNEENGNRGGKAYPDAPERSGEKHVAMIESDRGGFAPRGITVQADSSVLPKVQQWSSLFERPNAGRIQSGYSGVDVFPTVERGVPGFGLDVESHRYFDYHHSDNDTIDKVNPRELEMGAIVEALLCWLISEEGL
ncbi:MAG: peptidase [Bacteroidetes bacterium]|nr:peptidase [Bacteroidota bacterium]